MCNGCNTAAELIKQGKSLENNIVSNAGERNFIMVLALIYLYFVSIVLLGFGGDILVH